MIDLRKRVIEVLDQTHLMSLGTVDSEGVWVADVIFIYDDDLNIYWMSNHACRHSVAILESNRVAGTITRTVKSKEPNLGIQLEGVVQKLEGVQFDLMVKHLAKRGYTIPSPSKALEILGDTSWYKLVPIRIDLIDEENFGFNRQTVPLQ
ncbi:MAG: pyridoxamine 5'-phosphate oxidase family protein [Candidatus Paceibacterota bacterium]|jgi:uncharacterized protein YhbP (UPF0306 family)